MSSTVSRQDFLRIAGLGAGAVAVSELGFDVARAAEIRQHLHIAGATERHSICPYCAVGCSMIAYMRPQPDGTINLLQIEGDPDSPVTRFGAIRTR